MELYLIRHTHAEDTTPDPGRRLSSRGHAQVATLARFLQNTGDFAPDEIWHSPLVRARETATLLVSALKLTVPLKEVRGLQPEDDPAAMAQILGRQERWIAVVGHEPHLSALGSVLVTGQTYPPVFVMRKGATLALERAGTAWAVRWHIAPALLG